MVKFNLRIFRSCQTKPSSPPPEPSSPPRHRHKQLPSKLPCSPSKPYDTVSPPFRFPLLPVPPFYDKKPRRNKSNIKTNSHRFREHDHDHDQPRRSLSDVGVRSRHNGGGEGDTSPEWGSPGRLAVFKKMVSCKVEGKVKESFAVVKRSEKPYEDFKKSMMEMIVENQMYEESDLKQLLECFLSLNSLYHHGVIVEAFSEIWNNVFVDR